MSILKIKMQENDAKAETVGDYLKILLAKVWEERECFSGKRPFGNSGWKNEIFAALVAAGAVKGALDSDGYLEDCDDEAATKIILKAINEVFA